MTKNCNKCNTQKNFSEFHNKADTKDKKSSVCKACSKIYRKQRYPKRKQEIIKKNYQKRQFLRKEINSIKEKTPCKDCDMYFPAYCMDFDHIKNKHLAISKMIHECYSLKNIKKEILKTEIVCVMCHKTRTLSRKPIPLKQPAAAKRNFKFASSFKEKLGCQSCNKEYPPHQLEFDHLSNKKKNISHMVAQRYAINTIKKEIEKCQVLCSMCHRIKTAKERWNY